MIGSPRLRPSSTVMRNPRLHHRSPTMKRLLTVLGLGVFSLGLGACSHGMPTRPYNQDASTLRATTPDAHTLTDVFDTSEDHALVKVFTAAGDIAPTVADYQQALGNLNANT